MNCVCVQSVKPRDTLLHGWRQTNVVTPIEMGLRLGKSIRWGGTVETGLGTVKTGRGTVHNMGGGDSL